MSDPKNLAELNARIVGNAKIDGFGLDVTVTSPCPFCGVAGWGKWRVIDSEREMQKSRECKSCGRSARAVIQRGQGGISFEIVQTGGPDQPDWMEPKMRRIT